MLPRVVNFNRHGMVSFLRHYMVSLNRRRVVNLSGVCIEAADRELSMITSDGDIEMTDDERITRINGAYADMQDKYSFVKHFEQVVKILALSRQRESNDINLGRSAYNLK